MLVKSRKKPSHGRGFAPTQSIASFMTITLGGAEQDRESLGVR